jgi:hypothetical protein
VRSPLCVSADPLSYRQAGAWAPLSAGSRLSAEGYEALINTAIKGDDSFEHRRERVDEFGWRNFGELYADHEAVHPGAGSREPFDSRDAREDAPVPLAQGGPPESRELIPEAVLAARPFADLISSVAAAHDVDARLVHAVIEQESNYQARARSKKGARGLMQLMPATARQYGVANSYDPRSNLEAGVRHLKGLLSRLELPLALAAYNAGEATIRRYGGLPPFPETQSYVRNILRRIRPPIGTD